MDVRGRAFTISLDYLEHEFGGKKVCDFFVKYPEFERVREYSDLNWYGMDIYLKFSEAVDKYFGFGDAAMLFKIGSYSAKNALETSHKLYKGLSMDSAISKAQAVLYSYFSAGAVEVKYLKERKASLFIRNFPVSPYISKIILGWMRESVKCAAARDAYVSEQENRACLCYTVEWNSSKK